MSRLVVMRRSFRSVPVRAFVWLVGLPTVGFAVLAGGWIAGFGGGGFKMDFAGVPGVAVSAFVPFG